MATKPESRLRTRIKDAILESWPEAGFVMVVHGGPFQAAGFPDLLVYVEGIPFAMEVKRPGREHTLTRLQAHTILKLRKAGVVADYVTSIKEATDLVKFATKWRNSVPVPVEGVCHRTAAEIRRTPHGAADRENLRNARRYR